MITAPELAACDGVRHGFFTRTDGVSDGLYASLNIGLGSDDLREHVLENRNTVAKSLDVTPQHLLTLYQIHSATVITVRQPADTHEQRADAMVTDRPGLALGVMSADCAPVLFADQKAGIVGAAHAGWGGAFRGVLEATVDAMEQLGADRARITAVIGPCIAQPSYEVGPEFLERFVESDAGNARFFVPSQRKDHHRFDLPGYGLSRLHKAGIEQRAWTGQDTCADAAQYFSYRRSVLLGEADYGRQISAIRLVEADD
ncbi:MAG: peptidoglycan editing factor PgeF [Alphaproteobacteria bacterium]|jgi:polyphenol oxidase|nr:peptidoglycan editing factor PgeF [Rhodospirillaceae bacterium]MDG2481669.1 peptidoglycan editing factor PgeF [Alphaproteobacteria bacterium]MBT6204690.1 peptidoglycan editing factor PgeF [Rhodospirillaceae bacterium]MBT6512913.1 peptidoglycan editing factor PgeF [Rhodospirillaceae bacterium]MBT7615194.1 peptidoglycan editing factor PgeF [Rhodospirillaceae bacterium]